MPKKKTLVRQVVCEWYGLVTMPMCVQTREEEQVSFEADHSYISPDLWLFVSHPARQVFRWSRDADIDFVVWHEGAYRMIQDIVFKDAYPDATAWNNAVLEVVRDTTREVWVVSHGGA